ncbi:hypothetical protein [Lysobacter silvisoli]|uniref:PH domain-containing protein n=1 Tax=Lysobacter silvisoli TaxID=2293254 RepID=A0A371K555_9GAMM|nr:hypothetical protein [Lysobacter silvisoli]RDZ29063.1 hypothetical protein DX914_08190 [Lysobacter silvisoli]
MVDWDAIVAIAGAAVVLVAVVFALPLIYDYRFANGRVEVVLFGKIPVYWIDGRDIESIEVGDWNDLGLFTVHAGNRLRRSGIVVIRRKTAVLYQVAITPRHPRAFVAQVQRWKRQS